MIEQYLELSGSLMLPLAIIFFTSTIVIGTITHISGYLNGSAKLDEVFEWWMLSACMFMVGMVVAFVWPFVLFMSILYGIVELIKHRKGKNNGI